MWRAGQKQNLLTARNAATLWSGLLFLIVQGIRVRAAAGARAAHILLSRRNEAHVVSFGLRGNVRGM